MGRQTNGAELLMGVLVGGVAVGASALFLNSKQGRHLRRNLLGKLQEYSNQAADAVEVVVEKTREAEEWGKKATKRAKKALNSAVNNFENYGTPHVDLKIGLVVGGVLCGALAFGINRYLRNREQPHAYGFLQNFDGYVDGARNVIDKLAELFADRVPKARSDTSNALRDWIELASAGLQLVQNFRNSEEE